MTKRVRILIIVAAFLLVLLYPIQKLIEYSINRRSAPPARVASVKTEPSPPQPFCPLCQSGSGFDWEGSVDNINSWGCSNCKVIGYGGTFYRLRSDSAFEKLIDAFIEVSRDGTQSHVDIPVSFDEATLAEIALATARVAEQRQERGPGRSSNNTASSDDALKPLH